jgi:hypothetical protein
MIIAKKMVEPLHTEYVANNIRAIKGVDVITDDPSEIKFFSDYIILSFNIEYNRKDTMENDLTGIDENILSNIMMKENCLVPKDNCFIYTEVNLIDKEKYYNCTIKIEDDIFSIPCSTEEEQLRIFDVLCLWKMNMLTS